MALGSGIEWTESTWNPVTGCNKISPGCKYCYAERMADRLQAMGQPNYKDGFKLTLQPKMLEMPLQWKKPQTIFVNSMSDLFHKNVPLAYVQRVFSVMRRAHWHRFQVLTKRADRVAAIDSEIDWPPNVWMGVSVENADYVDRIDDLRSTGAHVKFLSLEPLLGPLANLNLRGIDWVIVGGESGPRARPMDPQWVTDIRDQCRRAGVAFFFKQWGGKNKKKAGRVLDGRTWDDMPKAKMPSRRMLECRMDDQPEPPTQEDLRTWIATFAPGAIVAVTAERDQWKSAAEAQNNQWSQKCTELTEERAAHEATVTERDALAALNAELRADNERRAARVKDVEARLDAVRELVGGAR